MAKLFIPYDDGLPKAVDIKGHRLLILATTKEDVENHLDAVGGDEVRELTFLDDESDVLAELAASINGGVVLAPPGMNLTAMIVNLEAELPWVH